MEGPSNGDLATDIILEILLRLPVKSLMKFKCVCKQWYTLIGSRSFVNQHFGHESNQERLLIRHNKPHVLGKEYIFALYIDETFSRYEEPDHLQMPDTAGALLGPLNGVFCVVSPKFDPGGEMALLNPAMRQFKPLPLIQWNVQPHLIFHFYLLGFGLDPWTGDYKVVWIQYFWNNEMNVLHCPPLVYVYNSGNDSWKHFENVDLVKSMKFVYRSLSETYLNGVYCWLVQLYSNAVSILGFDMNSEKFHEIQVPDCVKGRLHLSLYDDSIALLSYDCVETIDGCINVWVMKKEGWWTKRLTLGPLHGMFWPRGFWKNNELLLERGNLIFALNVSNQKLRRVESPGSKSIFWRSWFFRYKDSLVSIKGGGDNCNLWDTSSDIVKNFFSL